MADLSRLGLRMLYLAGVLIAVLLGLSPGVQAADFRVGFVSDGSYESLRMQDAIYQELSILLGDKVDVQKTALVGQPTPASMNTLVGEAYADPNIDAVVMPGFFGSNLLYNRTDFTKPTLLSWVIDPAFTGSAERNQTANLYWLSARNDIETTFRYIRQTLNPARITLLLDAVAKAFLSDQAARQAQIGEDAPNLIEAFQEHGAAHGMQVDFQFYDPERTLAEQVPADTELVMLPPLENNTGKILEDLTEMKIPVYSYAGRRVVEQGALMSVFESAADGQIARRVAIDLYSLYQGESMPTGGRWLEPQHQLTLNMAVARRIGVDLPIDVISSATIVGMVPLDARRVDLSGVVEAVLQQNLTLAQAQQQTLLAAEGVTQARADLLPQLSAQLDYSLNDASGQAVSTGNPEDSTRAALGLSQSLYSVNKHTQYKGAKLNQAANTHAYQAARQDMALAAISQYLGVLSAEAAVESGVENLRLSRSNLAMSEKRASLGSGTQRDVYTATAAIAQAESGLLASRVGLLEARRALGDLSQLTLDDRTRFDIADTSHSAFFPSHQLLLPYLETLGGIEKLATICETLAENSDPSLLASGVDVDVATLQAKAARRGRFIPEFSLNGQAYRYLDSAIGNNGLDLDGVEDWSVGVNMSLPLWSSGRLNSLARQASVQQTAAELAHRAALSSAKVAARDSVFTLAKSWRDIKLGKVELESAEQSLKISERAYVSGAITIDALQNAQTSYVAALNQAAADKYQYLSALASWQRRVGVMPMLVGETAYQRWTDKLKVHLEAN